MVLNPSFKQNNNTTISIVFRNINSSLPWPTSPITRLTSNE